MALNPKQQRFVQEYLIDLNATQAAIRAGYAATNADVTGPRMLGNVGVATAIAAAQGKRSEDAELSQGWVIRQLRKESIDATSDSARVAALKLLGLHIGMWKERRPLDELLDSLPPGLGQAMRRALADDIANRGTPGHTPPSNDSNPPAPTGPPDVVPG